MNTWKVTLTAYDGNPEVQTGFKDRFTADNSGLKQVDELTPWETGDI
jgi:hypothetical protein